MSHPLRNALAWSLLTVGMASALDAAPPEPPAPAARESAKTGDKAAPAPPLFREQAYYVPYEQLEEIFQKSGKGIFLPYEEFLKLWEAAQPKPNPQPQPSPPPAAAVLRGGIYQGAVTGEVARFSVSYAIQALREGWSDLRLPLQKVAIEDVTLSDPRALFQAAGDAYYVHLPAPGAYEVKLTLSVPVASTPGKKRIEFQIPPTAVSRLELTIPQKDLRVTVEPSLVVSQTTAEGEGLRVLAFLGNAQEVAVSWMPPVGKVVEDGGILFAQQSLRVYLGERILRLATDVDFKVQRGQTDSLRIAAPKDMRLLSISDDNVREWTPAGDDIIVRLHAPLKQGDKDYRLSLSFERILDATPAKLAIPFPRAQDVLRESGWVVLGYDTGLLVRIADSKGLSQLDPQELPEPLRPHLGVGLRYLAQPLELGLEIEKILPEVQASTTSVVSLSREEDQWVGWVDYQIEKSGIFRLSLAVGAGWNVEQIGDPTTVEEFKTTTTDATTTIAVSLKNKALGAFRLPFRLVREGLGKPGELELAPPRVLDVQQDRGLLGVSAPRALELSTRELAHLIDADVDELFKTGIMGQVSAQAGIPRVWRYREQPASAKLTLKDKQTEINLVAQHLVEVADGGIKVSHLLDYQVQYAPVESLQFVAPSQLDEQLKVEAKQKTEVTKAKQEGGRTLWTVRFQPPALGAVTVTITHALDLQGLVAGQPFAYDLPLVHGQQVRGEQGYVAVRKEGTLEIVPEPQGMEAIEVGDLPGALRRGQIYSAFRYFSAAPALKLKLTRYEYEELATCLVRLLRQRSVLSQEAKLLTEASLVVQNTDRQYLEIQLPEGARILDLKVNGQTQAPKKRQDGAGTLVEIPSSASGGAIFPVLLAYEQAIAQGDLGWLGGARMENLRVLGQVPVSKTELELYLPAGAVFLGWAGDLFPRASWSDGLWGRFRSLLALAAQTADASGFVECPPEPQAIFNVQVEGLPRRFDALGPGGALTGYYLDRDLFWALDFALLLLGALATFGLFRRRPLRRLQDGATFLVAALIPVLFFGDALRELGLSLYVGVLLVSLVFVGAALRRGCQAWCARRATLKSDPFIEEAPLAVEVAPAAGEAPAAETKGI